ncbi:MAG: hypothetical protein FWH37_03800 [Candidatus Bathyarchaeota archaeon]|nr:hypothetical protein [Candidatus Termiticorpusculum sp.]
MNSINYPERLIRGLSSKDDIDANGFVTTGAFMFGDISRVDGNLELSINWYDDEKSLEYIFEQKKDDESQKFKFGAAILKRQHIDGLICEHDDNYLSYERAPIENNKYHGNLLLKNTATKQYKKVISGFLAAHASKYDNK